MTMPSPVMSFQVEVIDSPSAEDRSDLIKIYNDAPQRILDTLTPEQLVDHLLSARGYTLYAARYNGRLLGAAVLHPWTKGLRMRYLVVRKVSRRKGVAIELLNHVRALADMPIYIDMPQNTATDLLFDKAGFTKLNAEEGRAFWRLDV
ncbi:acetyl-CoA sensor PanZ family protein [Gynuella sunshinyii]|uniref:Sortase and related acyltransferase n=1 Tax=Gynuella sunshinyii YC6258 TaxID=1445510 RepID=A0A0C5VDJ7_9GAMM|nr:acetyl-CoA sensor PanZ family protein [Gynuella sunshinyii]AJQ92261.1 sortase and related acyltransferase [Gynuella sunshinyii YC6258]